MGTPQKLQLVALDQMVIMLVLREKNNADLNQKSIYSGYKKFHGLTMLSLMLPTSIHYVCGPCSIRENDRWMCNQSGFNQC